jgi:hypothetical protein
VERPGPGRSRPARGCPVRGPRGGRRRAHRAHAAGRRRQGGHRRKLDTAHPHACARTDAGIVESLPRVSRPVHAPAASRRMGRGRRRVRRTRARGDVPRRQPLRLAARLDGCRGAELPAVRRPRAPGRDGRAPDRLLHRALAAGARAYDLRLRVHLRGLLLQYGAAPLARDLPPSLRPPLPAPGGVLPLNGRALRHAGQRREGRCAHPGVAGLGHRHHLPDRGRHLARRPGRPQAPLRQGPAHDRRHRQARDPARPRGDTCASGVAPRGRRRRRLRRAARSPHPAGLLARAVRDLRRGVHGGLRAAQEATV